MTEETSDAEEPPMRMDQISVYDIRSSAWYGMNATGDVPTPRRRFCAGVSAAPDQSSFQVTIYGGRTLSDDTETDEIYVLDIPSFRWIKVSQNEDPAAGRFNHACATHNDAQMVVIGGSGPPTGEVQDGPCDSDYPLIRVLDTATYTWKSDFDPTATYSVPEAMFSLIGEE